MCVCVFERKRKCETGVHTFTQLSCKHLLTTHQLKSHSCHGESFLGAKCSHLNICLHGPPHKPRGVKIRILVSLCFCPSKHGEACPCFSFALTSTDLPTPGILCEKVPELSHRSEEAADNHFFCASRVPGSGPGTRREVGQAPERAMAPLTKPRAPIATEEWGWYLVSWPPEGSPEGHPLAKALRKPEPLRSDSAFRADHQVISTPPSPTEPARAGCRGWESGGQLVLRIASPVAPKGFSKQLPAYLSPG